MPLTGLDRRALLSAGAAVVTAAAASNASRAATAPEEFPEIPLWPSGPPGRPGAALREQEIPRSETGPPDDTAFTHVTRPSLFHAVPARPNGGAVLLCPGGSYVRVAIGRGGKSLMRHFAAAGYHVYLLKYRLPGDGWTAGPDAPLQDAQRALRLIRSRAGLGYSSDRIGVMGFSAGGHLAAMLSYRADPAYPRRDAIDGQPMGVRLTALLYPVATMTGPAVHQTSRTELLGRTPSAEITARYSVERMVAREAPPTFLAHAIDDSVVPVDNSLGVLTALRSAKVASELWLPEIGGHGFGLSGANGSALKWPALFADFAARHGLVSA